MRNYKRPMRRKEENFEPDSLQTTIVYEQMNILRKAIGDFNEDFKTLEQIVNDLFKGKVDKRIKRKQSV